MHGQPLTVQALKDDLQVERCGEVILLSPREDDPARREAVGFPCHDLDAIGPPALAIDVLLSAAAGHELVCLEEMPTASSTPTWQLPRLFGNTHGQRASQGPGSALSG